MTYPKAIGADAPPVHFDLEPFHIVAAPALAACPLVPPGQCLNPGCSRTFVRTREWQVYCGPDCRAAGEAEMRRIGHKAAPALLAWRMGKYTTTDPALRELGRTGRNYISELQRAWLADRQARVRMAKGQNNEP